MVFRTFFAVILVLVALLGSPVQCETPPDVCYKTRQKCCYSWYESGTVLKTAKKYYDCPTEECVEKLVPVEIPACKLVGHGYPASKKCEGQFVSKEVPKKVCHPSIGKCYKLEHYKYPKFSSKLKCTDHEVERKPEEFIDEKKGVTIPDIAGVGDPTA